MISIEEMLEEALFEGIVFCPYCEYGQLESDYHKCPECNKENPLRKGDYI